MAWRFIRQPNDLLARFSEVVDDFTHYDLSEAEAYDLALDEMGRADAREKVRKGMADEPIPGFMERIGDDGLDRFRDAIETVRIVHGNALADERLAQLFRISFRCRSGCK